MIRRVANHLTAGMAFHCPICAENAGSLEIQASLELPHDSLYDENTLQILQCDACHTACVGVYRESRRGSPDSEAVDHFGYRVSEEVLDRIRYLIRACPARRDSQCGCAAHRELTQSVFPKLTRGPFGRRRQRFALVLK